VFSNGSKVFLRKWMPLAISVLALVAVFSLADLRAFRGLASRMQWDRLPVIALAVLGTVIAFGWRWRTLMLEALSMQRSVIVAALGLGGNHILPLRGGDALRVVLSARGPNAPSIHAGVSALALEKVFDLIAVAAFGLASTAALVTPTADKDQINVVGIALAILVAATGTLLTARSGLMIRAFRTLARAVGLSPRLYRHLLRPLHHLRETTSPGRTIVLLLETTVLWLVLYVVAYLAIAQWVGISLSVAEAMVLLFAAALGLAIPAAPSGIGTFHAAVVAAFLLLGRPASEGLVLAVAVHGIFFIGYCACGAVALAIVSRQLGPLRVRGETV
jgi:hypothetical protein